MAEISKELLAKLMKAASPEEASVLLSAEGITDAPLDTVWQQLEALRAQDAQELPLEELRAQEAQELSLDELEDVAGGVTLRNWWTSGCAATVEPGSDCWGTDGGCSHINIAYVFQPNTNCPRCGRYCARREQNNRIRYICRNCGEFFT